MKCKMCEKKMYFASQFEMLHNQEICLDCYKKLDVENLSQEGLEALKVQLLGNREISPGEGAMAACYPKNKIGMVLKGVAIAVTIFNVISVLAMYEPVMSMGSNPGFMILAALASTVTTPLLMYGMGSLIQILSNIQYRMENPLSKS